MPLQYDGDSIIRHNEISYDSYHDYMCESSRESDKVANAALRGRSASARREWLNSCLPQFRNANIDSIGEHDRDAMLALKRAVDRSKRQGYPQSIIIGSRPSGSDRSLLTPKGKTWAIYAYINALLDAGVILDPLGQVALVNEVDIIDGYTEWRTSKVEQTGRRLFHNRSLVAIDDINSGAGEMKRAKYAKDAWMRFVTDAKGHPRIGIVTAFSGDYGDMSLREIKNALSKIMGGAEEVMFIKGVEGR